MNAEQKMNFDEALRIACIRRGLSNLLPAYSNRADETMEVLAGLDQQVAQLAEAGGFAQGDVWEQVTVSRKPTFQELANELPLYAVAAATPAGCVMYYTGKSGEEYLSRKLEDAFPYQTKEGAERKADVFTKFGGGMIWFVFDPNEEN